MLSQPAFGGGSSQQASSASHSYTSKRQPWATEKDIEFHFTLFRLLSQHHFLSPHLPFVDTAALYIIIVVILCAAPHHSFAECDVDPFPIASAFFPLQNTVQPIWLCRPPHENHVAWSQWKLQRRSRWRRRRRQRRNRFVLHQEVSLDTQWQGGDAGVRIKEALVVTVVRYWVQACGIVVDKAKVVGRVSEDLSDLSEIVKTLQDRVRATIFVTVWGYRSRSLAINEEPLRREAGCVVNAKDCHTMTAMVSRCWVAEKHAWPEVSQTQTWSYNLDVLICVSTGPLLILYCTL